MCAVSTMVGANGGDYVNTWGRFQVQIAATFGSDYSKVKRPKGSMNPDNLDPKQLLDYIQAHDTQSKRITNSLNKTNQFPNK